MDKRTTLVRTAARHHRKETVGGVRRIAVLLAPTHHRLHPIACLHAVRRVAFTVLGVGHGDSKSSALHCRHRSGVAGRRLGAATERVHPVQPVHRRADLSPNLGQMASPTVVGADENEVGRSSLCQGFGGPLGQFIQLRLSGLVNGCRVGHQLARQRCQWGIQCAHVGWSVWSLARRPHPQSQQQPPWGKPSP